MEAIALLSEFSPLVAPVANRKFLNNRSAITGTRIWYCATQFQKNRRTKDHLAILNIGLPVLLVIFAGWIYQQVRRRKYAN
jgi:hypothetical protein